MVAGPIKTDKRAWNQFKSIVLLHLLFTLPLDTKAQSRAPRIKEHPADTIVGRSEPATLRCVAEGKPKPSIQWYKDGLPLAPTDHPHRVLLEDGLLFLRVMRGKKESDEGVYWCVAKNSVGDAVSKNATLIIAVLRDEFRTEPRDVKVASGESASLECLPPKGVPDPSVHWTKDGHSLDVEEVNGRISVVDGGNLNILETLPSDSGVYRCVASNVAGERQSRPATLLVLRRPHFLVKPNNITALLGQNIEFHCQASPESDVSVSWSRDNGSLSPYAIVRRGSLRIDKVTSSDTGLYTCRAESQAGTSVASASLTVHSLPHFTRMPSDQTAWEGEAVSFPCEAEGSPKPLIFWTMEGSQELVFPKTSHHGSLYIDRITTQHAGRLTCVAVSAAGSAFHTATLQVLRREANSFNGDLDSSSPYPELSKPQNHPPMTQYELVQARRYLQQDVLVLRRVEGISATTLKIVWDVITDYNEYLEGVKIWFNGTAINKPYLLELQNTQYSNTSIDSLAELSKHENFTMATVHNSGSSSHILTGLIPYAQYDVFLMPFYKLLLGKPSNMKTGLTEEDVPSAPPQSVSAGVINATSAWIRWDPPPVHTWNGELSGYLIEVRVGGGNGGRVVGQMSLGAKTRAAAASSLRTGGRYSARAAAVTHRGHGPFSPPAHIHMVPTQTQRHYVQTEPATDKAILSMFQETWLLALSAILLVLVLVGAGTIVFIRRRRSKQRKSQKSTRTAITNAQQCLLGKEAVWLRERPTFEGSNEPRIEVLSCHQSLLHGGHSVGTMATEAEYSLPQHPSSMTAMPQADQKRIAPEPYASCAIYTELNYQDHTDVEDSCMKCAVSPGSYDNSMVRSFDDSNQFSNEDCSTCCRSSSSTLTKDFSEMTKCGNEVDEIQEIPVDECPSCRTHASRSSSHHDGNKEWAVVEAEYDYPQWHWLGRENSFRQGTHDSRYSNAGMSDKNFRMNLCDILPPPPYERESPYREMRALANLSGTSGCSGHSYPS
ncbi:roundabout homolog 3-like [Hyposmocoma kahamanoa]|uniref:roundabout homolog 3-like n=1 Tax=Hyposmocoma kahamanoa TaxID=1477025 RepID=UPI000E6D9AB1|nr:roundabout homolog 3-like [Hyposmocoma kahamanoa]